MAIPLEGLTNMLNTTNLKGFGAGAFGNNLNVADFANINKLDDFLKASDTPELLQGFVSKIQQGEAIENLDLSGLSNKDLEFVKDFSSLKTGSGPQEVTNSFSEVMGNYINGVDQRSKSAEQAIKTFASGGNIDVHSVMIAAEKASLSMQLTMQLRNKIVQAYQQIQQIRV